MKILFVHQNYPAQYKNLLQWLIATGEHEIVFLTQKKGLGKPATHHIVEYEPDHRMEATAYPYSADFEKCCANGAKVVDICRNLEGQGFKPDIVMGHTGWGEMLFLKELWPEVPVLSYFEYFYTASGGAVGFDPEYPISDAMPFIMRARNAVNYLSLEGCDRGQTASHWQKSGYPEFFHDKVEVVHEGIRTDLCKPNAEASAELGRLERPVTRHDEIFTFVARNMEPVRGFHVFMRALPEILEARPNARAFIIGGDKVSYGRQLPEGQSYRGIVERELGDKIDWSRVHFLGQVPYDVFVAVMQLSRCHVYLTVPFVPSWSMLEAMSVGATVVASDVAPVREFIEDKKTGFLVDFLRPNQLSERVIDVLSHETNYHELGNAARDHICDHFDFHSVALGRQLNVMNSLLPRKLHVHG
ncbi:MAG: glycosyltransferase [Pseudomonadota bacterium]